MTLREKKNFGNIVGKGENVGNTALSFTNPVPPGWLSGERVGLMTWLLGVRSPVEATFHSGVFSPLTTAEAFEKCS